MTKLCTKAFRCNFAFHKSWTICHKHLGWRDTCLVTVCSLLNLADVAFISEDTYNRCATWCGNHHAHVNTKLHLLSCGRHWTKQSSVFIAPSIVSSVHFSTKISLFVVPQICVNQQQPQLSVFETLCLCACVHVLKPECLDACTSRVAAIVNWCSSVFHLWLRKSQNSHSSQSAQQSAFVIHLEQLDLH